MRSDRQSSKIVCVSNSGWGGKYDVYRTESQVVVVMME